MNRYPDLLPPSTRIALKELGYSVSSISGYGVKGEIPIHVRKAIKVYLELQEAHKKIEGLENKIEILTDLIKR